jgi:hypothetical protein
VTRAARTDLRTLHIYEVRPRKDQGGVDLISDALPFGGLWYGEPNAVESAIGYAKHRSRSHDAVICVYDGGWQCDRNAPAQGRFQRVVTDMSLLITVAPRLSHGHFSLEVLAVVIGGVLVVPILAILRFLLTPFIWWWKNKELRNLVEQRRQFLLVYNPINGGSRLLTLFDGGGIGNSNENEHTWRVKHGCLEFFTDYGRLYSRFKLDRAAGRLAATNDPDVQSVFGQYLLPQY